MIRPMGYKDKLKLKAYNRATVKRRLKRILSVIQRFLGVIASKMLNITKRGRK